SSEFVKSLHHPLGVLILQISTIILVARIFGMLANKIGQPTVIGEIIAGIVLGPSLLGLVFPDVSLFLFPQASLGNLQLLSQIGLILFMFIIGMELDLKILKNKADAAVVVSHASIIFPYFLGMGLAYILFEQFAPKGISFLGFSLFMGIAMSITAFPVLARIIQERGLTKTSLGAMAITCAAADDITAWCLLAAVVAIVKAGTFLSALYTIALAVGYVLIMVYGVQPFLKKLGDVYVAKEMVNKKVVGGVFLFLLLSSYLTEIIGIHALFGAFLAGVIMPQNLSFKKILTEKIEDISLVLLLPLFFVFTGLRTQIGLLNDGHLWMVCLLIIFTAVLGKFGGSAIAARVVGQSWKESLSIGVLMNTRGLMELIVLNIGYDLGILSPEIFAMMVIMALSTTFLTGPSLDLINRVFKTRSYGEEILSKIKTSFHILISFGPPKMGSTLLRLGDQLTLKKNSRIDVTALHITPSSEVKPQDAILYEKEGFQPIRATAQLLDLKLQTVYKTSEEVETEIIEAANERNYDLVLVGAARPLFNDKITGGKLNKLLEESTNNVAVLVDRGFVMAENVLVLLHTDKDLSLLQYAERFVASNKARVTIMKMGHNLISDDNRFKTFKEVIEHRIPDEYLLSHFNLVLVSLEYWDEIAQAAWISHASSILVIKHLNDLKSDDEIIPRASESKIITD
ncbi:MAG TPA: cation:proton antiporter, partial [Cyclobacteriaceae bacterium]|nr:cation:proton antiporter [Cyclobacteriaceae bacterium]